MCRIIFLLVAISAIHSFGQEALRLDVPAYGSSFQEIKTYQEQALKLGGTKTQIREIQRNILKARYGETGVERMFQNYSPDPTIENIDKTIRLAASDNPNQAKGYKRTLLFEKEFTKGGKFKVIATDKMISTRFGKTDVDLWLKDQQTGENVLVEVKENKLAGQNLQDYKLKVERLTDYAKRHGGRVAFLNRDDLKPGFKEFARNNDVLTYENVATGKLTGQKEGSTPFREMENHLGQGVASATTTDAAQLTRIQTAGKYLETGGKRIRRAGTVVLIVAEIYYIQGFARGKLSDREFYTAQSTIIVGAGGAWAGAETGGAIGLIIAGGPEDPLALITFPIGAIIGGFAGGFGGATLGNMAASGFYGQLDENQKQQVEAFIYQNYGVSR